MKPLKSILCASLLTLALSPAALAGNITTRDGNITTRDGNITTRDGNITTRDGNITTIPVTDICLMLVTAIIG
jgi:hypothetical protein